MRDVDGLLAQARLDKSFFSAAINTSSGGGMSSTIRRCSRSFAARSYFTVSIGTTSATVKTFVQLDHKGR
jgi:hypothetical protein